MACTVTVESFIRPNLLMTLLFCSSSFDQFMMIHLFEQLGLRKDRPRSEVPSAVGHRPSQVRNVAADQPNRQRGRVSDGSESFRFAPVDSFGRQRRSSQVQKSAVRLFCQNVKIYCLQLSSHYSDASFQNVQILRLYHPTENKFNLR